MKLTPAEIRAVIALAVGMFCVQVDFFALNLALPRMAVDLNETTTNMQWVISAYMIAVGAAMIPGGRLGDLRGHSRMVVAGLAVFGGASLICGLSSSYGLLIGFRALQGLGAAALFTVSVAAASNAVVSDHRLRSSFKKILPGHVVFMWVSKRGLSAIGRVTGPSIDIIDHKEMVHPPEAMEIHCSV